ncbi:MAG TPA: DUF4124 domain-containing protein [Xanthomonadales bacterium]|nr:DUF4124 domain-containing protein [Xanthomonadales bacterium]
MHRGKARGARREDPPPAVVAEGGPGTVRVAKPTAPRRPFRYPRATGLSGIRLIRRLFAFALLACAAAAAAAQPIYKWTDANGVVHYGDAAPAGARASPVTIEPPPPVAGGVAGTPPAVADGGRVPRDASPAGPADIVMYSRADCGYCAQARRYFAQRGIPYREKDVGRYAQARAEWMRLGGRGVPLFVIDGEVSHGFSAGGMTRRLARDGR